MPDEISVRQWLEKFHTCLQGPKDFSDQFEGRESSLVKLGLFLVNWRFRPLMMLVVYIIFRISGGYS